MNDVRAPLRLLQALTIFLVALAFSSSEAHAADKSGISVALGPGSASCGTWVRHWNAAKTFPPDPRNEHADDITWVTGFLSAYNRYVWPGQNVASETDLDGWVLWMDNYCAANPTKTVLQATEALAAHLAFTPHPNDK